MSKTKTAIVVDSTAYIPEDLVKKHDLHVIPLNVNWDGESLKDNVDITPDQFYLRLQNSKTMPSTSQPSAGEFLELFQQLAESYDSILTLVISGELSGTLASATAARDMMPEDFPIEIIDTRSTAMGLGFITLAAARVLENGATMAEAAAVARKIIPETRIYFVVDTLEFLHRGGRIGGAKRFIGSMLSIKPLLHLVDGRIESHSSVRTKKKAIKAMIDHVTTELQGRKNIHITAISAMADAEAAQIRDEIKARINPEEIWIAPLSPVIGTHVGPGAVGLIFYSEP
jgi:DegV family protein with EDD domain